MNASSPVILSARLVATLVAGWLWLPTLAQTVPPPPAVKIVAADPVALEGSSSGAFTIVREGDLTAALGVDLEIGGTASNGVDYATIASHLAIPAGFAALDVVVQPLPVALTPADKTVRLTLMTNASYVLNSKRSAVVTIVENRFNDLPPVVTITSPTNATVVTTTQLTITAEAADQDGTIIEVSFFDGDHFLGSVSKSPYTFSWTGVTAGKHVLFAKATDAVGLSAFSKAVNISVQDVAPIVAILNPTNNSVFGGGPITINASATDRNDAVVKVSFYANDRFLGSATSAPYSVTWSNAPAGRYSLFARAVDGFGQHAVSAPVSIRVTNTLPVIKLTSPTNNAGAVAPASFTLTAEASDPDGSIQQVSFYVNEHLLTRVTAAPYTFIWGTVPAGRYVIRAVATDNQGGTAYSEPVKVQVSPK